VAAIIYNDGTFGTLKDVSLERGTEVSIPVISVTKEDGEVLLDRIGGTARLSIEGAYAYAWGT